MKNLKDILEKLKVDDITFDEFPINGTADDIVEFLEENGFKKIDGKNFTYWRQIVKIAKTTTNKAFILDTYNTTYKSECTLSLKIINSNTSNNDKILLYNRSLNGSKRFRICKLRHNNDDNTDDFNADEKEFLNELNKIL